MNRRFPTPVRAALVAICLLACLPLPAQEPPGAEERIDRHGDLVAIFSGDVHVPADTRQLGTVVCLGGNALIEGVVTGDVVVILGTLENRGEVRGAVTGVLSEQTHEDAFVRRELFNVLGSLDMRNTRVSRELVNIIGGFRRDASSSAPSINIGFGSWFPSFGALFLWFKLVRLFGAFVVVLLLVALVPERIRLIADEAPVRYATAFFVGILGYLGLLVLLGLLTATVIGLPFAIVAWAALKWLGVAGIFFALGRRVGRSLGREMSLLGAILLVFAVYAVITLAPAPLGVFGLLLSLLIGTMFFVLIQVPAVGLVLLTLAGGRNGRSVAAPPAPPASASLPGPPTG